MFAVYVEKHAHWNGEQKYPEYIKYAIRIDRSIPWAGTDIDSKQTLN